MLRQQDKINEVLSAAGFLFCRTNLEKMSQRCAALSFFYPFSCDVFHDAAVSVRQKLWSRDTAPFPFDILDKRRTWWPASSEFLTRQIPNGCVRWVLGEDVPGGQPAVFMEPYPAYLNPTIPWPDWLNAMELAGRDAITQQVYETFALSPRTYIERDGMVSSQRLFEVNWLLEFARCCTPPVGWDVEDFHIGASVEYGPNFEAQSHSVVITVFSQNTRASDVASLYETSLAKYARPAEMNFDWHWPHGGPVIDEEVRMGKPSLNKAALLPSLTLHVYYPWPSKRMVEARVEELLSEYGALLGQRPSRSDTANWIRALATYEIAAFAGLSARRAISTWNQWARAVPPEACAISPPTWSDIEQTTSPAEQHFSRDRAVVKKTFREFHSQNLCTVLSPTT